LNVYPGFRRLAPVGIAPVHASGPDGVLCCDPCAAAATAKLADVTCELCRKIIRRTADGRKALRVDRRGQGAGRTPHRRGAYK